LIQTHLFGIKLKDLYNRLEPEFRNVSYLQLIMNLDGREEALASLKPCILQGTLEVTGSNTWTGKIWK
jgi:hypothetical protein